MARNCARDLVGPHGFNFLLNALVGMEPKRVLVVCSSPRERAGNPPDFMQVENQFMVRSLVGDDFVPTFMNEIDGTRFPTNIPDIKFDLVYFAGCNLLQHLFDPEAPDAMGPLLRCLKDSGQVVFSESRGYVKKYGGEEQYRSRKLTVPIEMIATHSLSSLPAGSTLDPIVNEWNMRFELDSRSSYVVYKRRDIANTKNASPRKKTGRTTRTRRTRRARRTRRKRSA